MNETKIAERMEYKKALEVIAEGTGDKKEYMEYFEGKLKKHGISSPAELDDEKKKKFFEEVDAGWKADHEEKKASLVSRRAKGKVPEAFKKQWKDKDKDNDGKENEPKPDFLKKKDK
jgi:hypothetical protein